MADEQQQEEGMSQKELDGERFHRAWAVCGLEIRFYRLFFVYVNYFYAELIRGELAH